MKENRKRLITITVSLLLMIVLVIGLTYAAFTYTSRGIKENIVSTSAVTMNYTEGNNRISLENAMPIEDSVGRVLPLNSDQAFYFTVSIVTGSATPIGFEVTAEKLTAQEMIDNGITEIDDPEDVPILNNNEVRLYLERAEENVAASYSSVLEPTVFTPLAQATALGASAGEMMLDFGTVSETKTYHYILRMWVGENYNVDNVERYFSVRVNVYGTDSRLHSNGISLNKNTTEIEIDESEQLVATINPDITTDKTVTWTSSNSSIATVDTMGNITGVSAGTSTITATSADGRKATCTVTVTTKSPTAISGIVVDGSSVGELGLTLTTEEEKEVGVSITPNDYDDSLYQVTWTTSDSSVVDIEEVTTGATGTSSDNETIIASKMASKNVTADRVKLVAGSTPGSATITATIKDRNNNDLTKSISITVQYPDLESIDLNINSVTVDRTANPIQLITTLDPTNVNNSDLTWESSNTSVATVSSSGVVTPVAKGTATITVSGTTGSSDTCIVTVRNELSSNLSFTSNQTVNVGATPNFVATLTPSDARDVDYITWTSSDTTVADVSGCYQQTTCVVEALKRGTTTITVETKDEENGSTIRSASATLTVNEKTLVSKIQEVAMEEGNGSYITEANVNANTTLFQDATTDNNIRFTGVSPNNYVNFNCDLDGTNCELWRIVGVFNNIKSSENDTTGSTRVKIMRATSIGYYSWDAGTENDGWGTNKWEEGDLMHLLNDVDKDGNTNETWTGQRSELTNNGLYWYNQDGTCFNGQYNSSTSTFPTTSCNFETRTDGVHGLKTATTRNMISTAYWNLGGMGASHYQTILSTAVEDGTFLNTTLYNAERGSTTGASGGSLGWEGKVALNYPSDYAYAGYNCNIDYQLADSSGNWTGSNDIGQCNQSNWMFNGNQSTGQGGSREWFLSPSSATAHQAWTIHPSGAVSRATI